MLLARILEGNEDLAYSGTRGIAREATFWGIPAIGFSRVKEANVREGDAAWLARFIERLWQTRNEWAMEGHWLSVNFRQICRHPSPSHLSGETRSPARWRFCVRMATRSSWSCRAGASMQAERAMRTVSSPRVSPR